MELVVEVMRLARGGRFVGLGMFLRDVSDLFAFWDFGFGFAQGGRFELSFCLHSSVFGLGSTLFVCGFREEIGRFGSVSFLNGHEGYSMRSKHHGNNTLSGVAC